MNTLVIIVSVLSWTGPSHDLSSLAAERWPIARAESGLEAGVLPRRGALGLSFTPVPADLAAKHGLKAGEGLVAQTPAKGLTAEKVGFQAGDLILSLNGEPVTATTIGAKVRGMAAGTKLSFRIVRGDKAMELSGSLVEKPRDPGNANYTVTYSHVDSAPGRMRTIITTPKKPGKHPVLFFIQGFSPVSYDFTLETATGDVASLDGPILRDFANSGFVTVRVEKPGVGDSEGGPFADLDYTIELDIYRQALKQAKALPEGNPDQVFIFGHSMGGAFGPMVAAEIPVKGIAVYGVASRTWFEYLVESFRKQGQLGGATFEAVDENVRQVSQLVSLLFHENKTVDEVRKSHPALAPLADSTSPGGYFNGKTLKFWDQLSEINFPAYWSKVNCPVLAVKGASDFVVFESDHQLIADVVNRSHPGWGSFEILPKSDHLFHAFDSEKESQSAFSRGTYSSAYSKRMLEWIRSVIGKS